VLSNLIKLLLVFIICLFLSVVYFGVVSKNKSQVYINKPFAEIQKKETSILLAGDVMLGRGVYNKSKKLDDYTYPFNNVYNILQKSDIVLINLENPIVENCPVEITGMKFCSLPESLQGFLFSGIDVVNIANNHIANYGNEGVERTKKYLLNAGLLPVGLGIYQEIERNGTKIGFLGFDFTSNLPKESDFALINESSKKADFLIVSVHWGVEYTGTSKTYQKEWARKFIENGADVVVGHHPHWVQEIEYIKDGSNVSLPESPNNWGGVRPVYYSLGNFVFDQMWSEETKKGMVIELILVDGKITKENRHFIYMKDIGQPVFVDDNN